MSVETLLERLKQSVEAYHNGIDVNVQPITIAEILSDIRDSDEARYLEELSKLHDELKAAVLIELPSHLHNEVAEHLGSETMAHLTSELDTDDAAELLRNIDDDVANEVLQQLDQEERENLENLIAYGDADAGAYMQTELFMAYDDEMVGTSIKRLKQLKADKAVDNVYQVYVCSRENHFIGSVPLEDLILQGPKVLYSELLEHGINTVCVLPSDDIHKVVDIAARYDMSVVPVVNERGILIGRITSDDIYDIIEERATDQIYALAGVSEAGEEKESLLQIGRSRALWLGVNLLTAIAASVVIGLFDTTLQSLVALAILMPIVASMGGNAGTQTLTVTVRQMALGDISNEDAKETLYKEVMLSLFNGMIFALVIGIIAGGWFSMPLLGVVIAMSMVINLVSAGFFGALIPIVLQRFNIDPAVGSSVLLTTITDIVGFFTFLGLAKIILL